MYEAEKQEAPAATTQPAASLVEEILIKVKNGDIELADAAKGVGELIAQGAAATIAIALDYMRTGKPPLEEAPPAWVSLPSGIIVPKGRPVQYIRFKSTWTDVPKKGAPHADRPDTLWRWCVLWPLTDSEEVTALQRCPSNSKAVDIQRVLTQQMIRVIDGHKVDWSGTSNEEANIEVWWNEIGSRCRGMLKNEYMKSSSLSQAETIDFFANCVEARIGG